MIRKRENALVSNETFDDFLDSENLLVLCEEDAIKEIITDQIRDQKTSFDPLLDGTTEAAGLKDLGPGNGD